MVDIESIVFSRISSAIRTAFPSNFTTSTNGIITGEKVSAPSSFPAVCITEENNSVYLRSQDSSSVENHSDLMYEVEIYSNLSSGRKAQCKAIAKIVNDTMADMNFTRKPGSGIIPNANSSIARWFGRWTAVASKTEDNTVLIYRK